jgi:pimeloyl-ACP methyl ester carboxylesterase
MRRLLGGVAAVAMGAVALVGSSILTPAGAQDGGGGGGGGGLGADHPEVRPIIFIHGFLGSGQQFEAMALRLTSNGYPADHIEMFEHNSLTYGTGNNPEQNEAVWGRIDQLIEDLKARTGDDQVYLAGHSQGTYVSQAYLNSDPARAANVARYVNLDGATDVGGSGTAPGGVETLAIWGEGDPAREVPGAANVRFADQAHTEVVNSPETFTEVYEFLLGEPPQFTEVVREPADEIVVSGRAQLFPENTGATNATLEIFEVDGETGERLHGEPEATYELSGNGDWGPFEADGEAFYELAISRESSGTHHVYMQRFVRSSRWVRLLTSEPGGLADSFWELGDQHQNLVVMRNKEWWGDQGDAGDTLEVNGENVLTPAISPRSNRTIGVFVHDFNVDQRTDLSAAVSPTGIMFLTGADLYIPAADPPDGTTSVVATPRRGEGPEAVCLPNFASTNDRSSVVFNSYHRLLDPDGSPAEGHANPDCAPPPDRPAPDGPSTPPVAPPARPVPGQPSFTG